MTDPAYPYPRSRIAVFARQPVAGQVKTRLVTVLGEQGALQLYQALAARAMALVQESGLAPWQLWVSSNPQHEFFLSHCNKKDIKLQQGADLGVRMNRCLEQLLGGAGVDSALLIGTDCPAFTSGYLTQALQALESGKDLVLGPVLDGGYALIGLRCPQPDLFQGIAWSTPEVLAQTLQQAQRLGLEVAVLPELWDVDTPADLARLDMLQPPLDWR